MHITPWKLTLTHMSEIGAGKILTPAEVILMSGDI
jgi:hypothetical protein